MKSKTIFGRRARARLYASSVEKIYRLLDGSIWSKIEIETSPLGMGDSIFWSHYNEKLMMLYRPSQLKFYKKDLYAIVVVLWAASRYFKRFPCYVLASGYRTGHEAEHQALHEDAVGSDY